MAEDNNKDTLKSLIIDLDITQKQTAALLTQHTQRPVSERAVRTWLADPSLPSARACPDWAIKILEGIVNNGLH